MYHCLWHGCICFYKITHWCESFSFFWRKWHSEDLAPIPVHPCLVCVQDLPQGPDLLRGCRFSWRGKLFLAYTLCTQWCQECFLILRAWVKFSRRDSPEFSCCSEGGGRGVEPADEERTAGGWGVVSVASLPLIQWCFSGWQMLLNPPWPRELWWLSWVTGP